MKVITVQFIAREGFDAEQINDELQQSGVLNNWPVFCWTTEDASAEQKRWLREEYDTDVEGYD